MKVSVSLPGEDVEFLGEYAREQGLESRSAALHRAVRQLRTAELGGTYEAAWAESAAGDDGKHPAVIVSNDSANATAERLGRGVITVVDVTSKVERVYPFQVLLPAATTGLDRDCKAQAEQIRSIAVERVGAIPNAIMLDLDEALRLHLGP